MKELMAGIFESFERGEEYIDRKGNKIEQSYLFKTLGIFKLKMQIPLPTHNSPNNTNGNSMADNMNTGTTNLRKCNKATSEKASSKFNPAHGRSPNNAASNSNLNSRPSALENTNTANLTKLKYKRKPPSDNCSNTHTFTTVIQFLEVSFRSFMLQKNCCIIDVVFNDITSIKDAEKLTTEGKLKHSLFSKIAHEFKTPLTTIVTMIDELQIQVDNNNTHQIKDSLDNIYNLSNYTVFLINDIIQYASNNPSKIKIQKDKVNLKAVCNFCHKIQKCLLGSSTGKKRIKSLVDYDERVDKYEIISDEIRLKQIMLNFISNSVKFTKCGQIKISVKLVDISELVNSAFIKTTSNVSLSLQRESLHNSSSLLMVMSTNT